jgi:hypothetical protein
MTPEELLKKLEDLPKIQVMYGNEHCLIYLPNPAGTYVEVSRVKRFLELNLPFVTKGELA